MTFLARIRLLTFVLILLGVAVAPLCAQKLAPDGAPNPTASVTNQRTLLDQAPRIQGRIDIPDVKASVLIQPAGRGIGQLTDHHGANNALFRQPVSRGSE